MMKKISICMAVLAMFTAISCDKQQIEDNTAQGGKTTVFTASIANFQTKAGLGEAADGKCPVVWQTGDEVAIYAYGEGEIKTEEREFTNPETGEIEKQKYTYMKDTVLHKGIITVDAIDPTKATITVEGTIKDSKYIAMYPYSRCKRLGGYEFASRNFIAAFGDQTYRAGDVPSDGIVMSAYAESLSFDFKANNAILKLTIKGEGTVSSIKVTEKTEGQVLSGNGGHVFWEGTSDNEGWEGAPMDITSNPKPYVNLLCPDGVALTSEGVDFYVCVPPTTANSNSFSIDITDANGNGMIVNSKDDAKNVFQSGHILPMPAITYVATNRPKRLDKDETANCYIVSAADDYKFKCTVAGNGSTKYSTYFYIPEGRKVAPVSAELLWADTADLISNVSCDGSDIYFTASGAEGNAVIAGKDAEGNIVWSWHIWCTDQPSEHAYYCSNTNHNHNHMLMDRNLGATSAEPGDEGANGLYFQWGRKDPFPYGGGVRPDKMVLPVGKLGYVANNATNGTVQYAISHPQNFINGPADQNRDWLYNTSGQANADRHNNHLWGDPVATTNYDSKKYKTIYDPCPAGYCVAGKSIFNDYTATWDDVNKGASIVDANGNTAWFPASGRIIATGLFENFGTGSYIWFDAPYDPANTKSYMFARNFAYAPNSDGNQTYSKLTQAQRVMGMPVRCQKM